MSPFAQRLEDAAAAAVKLNRDGWGISFKLHFFGFTVCCKANEGARLITFADIDVREENPLLWAIESLTRQKPKIESGPRE